MRRIFCSESGLARFFTGFTLGRASKTATAQCSVFHELGGGKCQPCHFLSYSLCGNKT